MTSTPDLPTMSFNAAPAGRVTAGSIPQKIGRYRVVRELGRGGFGIVYLAHDEELLRQVAIKVPFVRPSHTAATPSEWLAEARIVANLDHPHIVPVFDVGSCPEFPAFIVSKLIDGTSLSIAMSARRLSIRESLAIVISMADALHYAHASGLVHRDVKPSNIILDQQGQAYLSDFGLALRDEDFSGDAGQLLGTLHYMSPEQARGEGHLVDGRADVFSLGVVLYELLGGTRPFQGRTVADILRSVTSHDPRPLRQRNDQIARELERICFRALSKRASDRYSTAHDFAEDLRHFLAGPESQSTNETPLAVRPDDPPSSQRLHDSRSALSANTLLRVVPKGLRAFDDSDSDFFLGLVPGPHDRDGLPQSLRFWKTRLEEFSPKNPLRVGVVYGPSGCGKSSLIRAGLLPQLSPSIQTLIVTATPQSTESQLLEELRPLLSRPAVGLIDAMQQLRRGLSPGRRVLVVLDQFEQWLHANSPTVDAELVQALRQCDGEHVACLLIARDDFWMSLHRLFQELDIRLAERETCAAVDLFDTRHARRVLHAFGQAYGALPERTDELSAEQREFLDRVIAELAEDDRVICVRLALFAQMVQNRPWVPATLTAIGGARGVGIRFLEDTFGATSAPLSYRAHQVGLREMLRALLPAAGTEIKACTRSVEELAAAARCDLRSADFRQMLDILENETRLLTPVDAPRPTDTTDVTTSRSYQLTHDYLVPSIREWLTRKQKQTWRGRCELRLEDRAALWSARPERKQLPSLWETAQITVGTQASRRTAQQSAMMQQAQRMHGRRLLALGLVLICVVMSAAAWHSRQLAATQRQTIDSQLDRLMVAELDHVPVALQELKPTHSLWSDRLRAVADSPGGSAAQRLRAELALVTRDPTRLRSLLPHLAHADVTTLNMVRMWLATEATPNVVDLWRIALQEDQAPATRLRMAGLLAEFDPQPNANWVKLLTDVPHTLVTEEEADIDQWSLLLSPIGSQLSAALSEQFLKAPPNSARRQSVAQALVKLGSTAVLCRVLPDADAAQLPLFLRAISQDRDEAVKLLRPILTEPPPTLAVDVLLRQVARQRMCCAALLLLGSDEPVWPLLQSSEDASLRTELILSLTAHGVPLESLFRGLETVRDPVARQAIWLAMAGTATELPADHVPKIVERLIARWPLTDHITERSAMIWLAKRCGSPEVLELVKARTGSRGMNWFVNSQGETFAQIRGPVEFQMGSPDSDPRRDENETLHRRKIDRSFSVALHEVTVAQFQQFRSDYQPDLQVARSPDCPAGTVTWFDAAQYCRWLSEQENIPEDQMCYPPIDQIREDMTFPPDLPTRAGYRLLTESEWEFVCRAGTTSRYFFGENEQQASEFAWCLGTSNEVTWPVGQLRPNAIGLFDIQGNVHEWNQTAFEPYSTTMDLPSIVAAELRGHTNTSRVYRGASYRSAPRPMRSAFRLRFLPTTKISTLGFRVAKTISSAGDRH